MANRPCACACGRRFKTEGGLQQHCRAMYERGAAGHFAAAAPIDTEPDWAGRCMVCDASPVVPATGLCGPCTFGDADTLAGNW